MTSRTLHRTFRVTHEEWHWLERIAAQDGQPVSTVIRRAIGEYVADYTDDVIPTFSVNTPTLRCR